jgi:hypothetical protein
VHGNNRRFLLLLGRQHDDAIRAAVLNRIAKQIREQLMHTYGVPSAFYRLRDTATKLALWMKHPELLDHGLAHLADVHRGQLQWQ